MLMLLLLLVVLLLLLMLFEEGELIRGFVIEEEEGLIGELTEVEELGAEQE